MINLAVSGADGRMGQLIIEAIEKDQNLKLIAKFIRANANNISEIINKLLTPIDVLIDFAPPSAVLDHLQIAYEQKYRMVIGSTGFTDIQKNKIKEAAKEIPIVFSPNMSIVANVGYKLLALAAGILKGSDIAILDVHHKHKKDAPSGTALHMAEIINQATGKAGSNNATDITISSLRLGDTVGEHTTLFSLEGERLEITHRTSNRSAYAKGTLQAAKWIINQPSGLYDMQDVLGL